MSNIRVYCCGGLGINIGKQFNPKHRDMCFIDTSTSNLREGLFPDRTYAIDGLDGSGKLRAQNHKVVARHIDTILNQFSPADFNVVLFSSSGGSGSVIGPLLIAELLKQGQSVVALTVGNTESKITVTNALNTMKSLQSISERRLEPVVVMYNEKHPNRTRHEIDNTLLQSLSALFILSSNECDELDRQDINHWLRYQKVSPVHPGLSFLTIATSRKQAEAVRQPISTASIYTDDSRDVGVGAPYYSTTGFHPAVTNLAPELHFVINQVGVEEVLSSLEHRETELEEAFSSYRNTRSLIDLDDDVTDDGLVL